MPALAAVGMFTLAMFVVAGVVALCDYRKLAVQFVRQAWINLVLLGVGALALTGALTLGFALRLILTTRHQAERRSLRVQREGRSS